MSHCIILPGGGGAPSTYDDNKDLLAVILALRKHVKGKKK